VIPTKVVRSVKRADVDPRQVVNEFENLLRKGAPLRIAGKAARDPDLLWRKRLKPKHKIRLFETDFYLTNVLQIPELRFFVGFVVQSVNDQPTIYPRIIYKDLSLAWRSASHFSILNGSIWVGKGDVRIDQHDGFETVESIEATTDLPTEMQTAVEKLLAETRRAANGDGIMELVLRQAPSAQVEPFADFRRPRAAAQADPKNLINHGQPVAWFAMPGDPKSLKLVDGFQPDFQDGIMERSRSRSRLYGGTLRRFRILSENRKIQYYFIAGARHVWIYPPQSTTTELTSFGVRTIDVKADDDLFIPGYEYHHWEQTDNGLELYSQIPDGYAGAVCPVDDVKADASPWLDQIPLIQEFRKQVMN